MPTWTILALAVAVLAWGVLVWLGRVIRRVNVRPGDATAGLVVVANRVYCRLVHGLRVEGVERAREARGAGSPVIVVCNHTAGIDPALVQAALDFEVRWMMAEDMRAPALEEFWRYGGVIFVDRSGRDTRSVREALRHLREGGALGVFPEGALERPAGTLMPFREGVGLLALKSGATVLPAHISGTPVAGSAWGSFFKSSRSRVRFLEATRYEKGRWKAEEVTRDLQQRFQAATGWPVSERRPILEGGRRIMVDREGRYVDERGERLTDEEAEAIRRSVRGRAARSEGAGPEREEGSA